MFSPLNSMTSSFIENLTTHFSVVVPKNVRVTHGTDSYDAGEIDGAACLYEQLLVAQNCRVRLCKVRKMKGYS